jgi:quinol monooxygenase YgiN
MIVLDVKFLIKEDCIAEAKAAMKVCAEATLKEEGCNEYRFATEFGAEDRVVLFEEWRSQGDLDLHFETPHLQHFRSQMADALVEPPSITRYLVSESGPL